MVIPNKIFLRLSLIPWDSHQPHPKPRLEPLEPTYLKLLDDLAQTLLAEEQSITFPNDQYHSLLGQGLQIRYPTLSIPSNLPKSTRVNPSQLFN
jgi:hypothetical protein